MHGINFWKKPEACKQNLTKERKQPPVVNPQHAIFYNVSILLCLWLRIIRSSDQGVLIINFHSQIFFNDINNGHRAPILKKTSLWLLPFFMAVATYCLWKGAQNDAHCHCIVLPSVKNAQVIKTWDFLSISIWTFNLKW